MKECYLTCTWNHSVHTRNGELACPHCRNSISRWNFFFLPNPKCRFIMFQYTNAFLWAKFGDLKPTIDETQCPQIWTCFWARRRIKIPQGNCDFLCTKCFININRSSLSTDSAAENSIPQVLLLDQRGDQPSKTWENLKFSSDSVRILVFSSQRHAMWS